MKTKCTLLVVNKYLIQPAQKEITLSKAGYFASISELISLEWWNTFIVGCDSPCLQGMRWSEVRYENIVVKTWVLLKMGTLQLMSTKINSSSFHKMPWLLKINFPIYFSPRNGFLRAYYVSLFPFQMMALCFFFLPLYILSGQVWGKNLEQFLAMKTNNKELVLTLLLT